MKVNKAIFFLISIIFLTISTKSKAQNFDVRSGINTSNVRFKIEGSEGHITADNMLGVTLNLGYLYKLSNKHKLHTELQYFRKGYQYRITDYLYEDLEKAKLRIHYLQTNLIYEWHPLANENIKKRKNKNEIYLFSGGYFAYKFSASWKYLEEMWENGNLVYNYKKTDFGIIIGTGMQNLSFVDKNIRIDIRYYFGLSNISEHPIYKIYNQNFEIGIQYHLTK